MAPEDGQGMGQNYQTGATLHVYYNLETSVRHHVDPSSWTDRSLFICLCEDLKTLMNNNETIIVWGEHHRRYGHWEVWFIKAGAPKEYVIHISHCVCILAEVTPNEFTANKGVNYGSLVALVQIVYIQWPCNIYKTWHKNEECKYLVNTWNLKLSIMIFFLNLKLKLILNALEPFFNHSICVCCFCFLPFLIFTMITLLQTIQYFCFLFLFVLFFVLICCCCGCTPSLT